MDEIDFYIENRKQIHKNILFSLFCFSQIIGKNIFKIIVFSMHKIHINVMSYVDARNQKFHLIQSIGLFTKAHNLFRLIDIQYIDLCIIEEKN